ncbi:MAG: hypothetical protein V1918_03980 [Planctomycetota bacterium]
MTAQTPERPSPPPKPPVPSWRRFLRRLGLFLLLLAAFLVIGGFLFGDLLLRKTVERKAAQLLGVPVEIGRLRLDLLGRPSLSLRDVRAGHAPAFLKIDKMGVTPVSLFGDDLILNVQVTGASLALSQEATREDGDMTAVLQALYRKPKGATARDGGAWAVPRADLRDIRVTFPAPGGSVLLQWKALHLAGLSSPGLQGEYPSLKVELRGFAVEDPQGKLLTLDNVTTALQRTSRGSWKINAFDLSQGAYADAMTDTGKTRLQAIMEALRSMREALPEETPPPPSGGSVSVAAERTADWEAGPLSLGPLDVKMDDARPGSQGGRLSFRSRLVRIQSAAIGPGGKVALGASQAEGISAGAGHGQVNWTLSVNRCALDPFETTDIRKTRPALSLSVEGISTSVAGPGPGSGGQAKKILAALAASGANDEMALDRLRLEGFDIRLALEPEGGLAAARLLQEATTHWKDALGAGSDVERKEEAPAWKEKRFFLRQGEFLDGRLALMGSPDLNGSPGLKGSVKSLALRNFSWEEAGSRAALEDVSVNDFAAGLSNEGKVLLQGSLGYFSGRELLLRPGAWPSAKSLSAGPATLHGGSAEARPIFRLEQIDLDAGDPSGGVIDRLEADTIELALNVGPDNRFVEQDLLEGAARLFAPYFPRPDRPVAPSVAPSSAAPAAGPLLVRNARGTSVRVEIRNGEDALTTRLAGFSVEEAGWNRGLFSSSGLALEEMEVDVRNEGGGGRPPEGRIRGRQPSRLSAGKRKTPPFLPPHPGLPLRPPRAGRGVYGVRPPGSGALLDRAARAGFPAMGGPGHPPFARGDARMGHGANPSGDGPADRANARGRLEPFRPLPDGRGDGFALPADGEPVPCRSQL